MRPLARLRGTDPEAGSIMWGLMVSLALLVLGTLFTTSVITTVQRSKAATDAAMLVQYTDVSVAKAIAALNANDAAVAHTFADSTVTCEKVAARSMCYRYWALPVPGNAVDPVRYDLLTRAWIDMDGDSLEPDGGLLVRSQKMPLEVITYQTSAGNAPTVADGVISYQATPSGLFGGAIASFGTATLEGAGLSVRAYNSATSQTGTGAGVVSSAGWVAYGAQTQADSTVLYGGAGVIGDHTSRCTGEACAESKTRVIQATYGPPTVSSTDWMRTVGAASCTTKVDGDWVTSEHGGQLPMGTSCINGSLVVDVATTVNAASPLTTVYVYGTIQVAANLNAPLTGQLASPASLVLYSTGGSVTFAAPDNSAVSAMLYAPLATCGNNPGTTSHMTYFGSLVCGTVSLAGKWEQLYDEAAIASYVDPVIAAVDPVSGKHMGGKTFAPGVASAVAYGTFLAPVGWDPSLNTCGLASPATATGYWRLDEGSGILARDSAGGGLAGGWRSTAAAARTPGVCGNAALLSAGGAVIGSTSKSSANGLSLEYWGRSIVGTSVSMAGVKVTHDDIRHVSVTVGTAAAVRLAFSVENYDQWHLFTVSVSPTGTVTLFVDGLAKATGTSAAIPSSTSGLLTVGDGAATGAIDEVVYYGDAPLTPTDVATRWSTLIAIMGTHFTTHPAGVAFSAPSAVVDGGSGPTLLKVNWTKPTGDFPTGDATVSYYLEVANAAAGPWGPLTPGTAPGTALTYSQANPAPGTHYYRVCAKYNGDVKCSTGVSIVTLSIPVAPSVWVTGVTTTTSAYQWGAVPYAATYESVYRTNGGAWSGVIGEGTNVSRTHGPTTEGTRIDIMVRAVNAAGTGPWSAVASALLQLSTPSATGWITGDGNPAGGDWTLHSRLSGVYCPAGSSVQSAYADQVTTWGGAWNAYSGWGWTDSNGYTRDHSSNIESYDVGARQLILIKCVNPASGAESAVTGPHGPIEIWHGVPGPWGAWVGITAYRTAGWGAGCAAQLTPAYRAQMVGAFNSGLIGPTFGTSYYYGGAWGSGTAYMTVWCEAPGGRKSGEVNTSSTFG
jgi:hypothetical protein